MVAQKAGPEGPPSLIYCRWDFCIQSFATYLEWEAHFTVEHVAYEKTQDLSGKFRRRRRADGLWELVEPKVTSSQQIPLDIEHSQTTGDTSMTSHTMSFPMPASFEGLLTSMPINMILPPQSPLKIDSNERNHEQLVMEDLIVPNARHKENQTYQFHSQDKPEASQDSGLEIGASYDSRLRRTPPSSNRQRLFVSPSGSASESNAALPHPFTQFTPQHQPSSFPSTQAHSESLNLLTHFPISGSGNMIQLDTSVIATLPAVREQKTPTSSVETGKTPGSAGPESLKRIPLAFGSAKDVESPKTHEQSVDRGGVGFGFGQQKQ
ncbi:uncharacterized protein L203_104522 [Cryptococcus depauperatus CBS 7841]|uniref:Uncharacterized protein n=1 Tax=Cryptococcus depauperatus CBS 7841 TaxID=1295531 RepID=A0A1E3IPF9_9TREE|nr:hypothetical protein L203_02284 [Cryptococcus depauperatus CBS 7841]